jgi:serine/threonine protein kinase
MRQADPVFMGLLYCDGFLWDSIKCRFELHFPIPSGLRNPRTLLGLLCDPVNRKSGVKHPLNQRIGLAKRIVTAVFVLHAANFVHKQIRPDNILVFEHDLTVPQSSTNSIRDKPPDKQGYPHVLGNPFLVGFDNVRKVDAASLMLPAEDWRKNIYLSPERQRLQRGDEFRMEHDIYSLGVVLLEIAFWASFQDKTSPQLGKLIWKDKSQSTLRAPQELKKMYMSLTTGAVPRLMGQKFADVVMACLMGLDLEEGELKRLEDSDGIIIGTRYIMEVIKKLEEISM